MAKINAYYFYTILYVKIFTAQVAWNIFLPLSKTCANCETEKSKHGNKFIKLYLRAAFSFVDV